MTIASLLAVLGAWLGFANPVYRLPLLALLLPMGLVLAAARAPSNRAAAKAGYWIGALAACGNLYWTALPIHDYGNLAWGLALPVPMLMGLVLGLYTMVLALAVRLAARRLSPWLFGPFCAVAWASMEMARGAFLSGFPWLTLAAAFSPWPAAIQSAAFVGAYGLSGVLAGLAAWLVVPGPLTRPGLAALVLGAALFFLGNSRAGEPAPKDAAIHATIIQGNVDQSRKWDPASQRETVEKYLDMASQAIKDAPTDLLVWPETTMPFYFQDGGPLAKQLVDFAAATKVPIIFGAPAYERTLGGDALFNRAYLLLPSGATSSYDKEHLVPFGEYVPFGDYLPFIHKLVEGVGDFKPGHAEAPLTDGRLALGLLICYEAIFPELAQQRVEAGANILVNISNDSWFGDSAAPRQHLDLALLRAVEQGRAIIRGTNSGISAVIDPRGHIMAQGGLFTALSLPCPEVPIVSETTWFHRHYTLVTWAMPVLFLALCLACALLPDRPSGPAGRGKIH
uniref:Apolipoprotein N-acyltransferase n=1 Tax=Desulfovibrio sp. U5L TaxID=596152 RepID=I2Q2B8_9BACT